MRSIRSLMITVAMLFSFAAANGVIGQNIDEDAAEVKARVSRISILEGEAKIKRAGAADWEQAVLNLPIVEGDEIVTESGARMEIQLNTFSYVRISESSAVGFTGLQDGAVALSVSQGSVIVRLTEFDKDSAFFEIDAPKTTIAIQKAGMYRIDTGAADSAELRITVTNNGEARVYSADTGFTLKNGRMATVNILGPLTGEWQAADASRFIDGLDTWSLDRDAAISKTLGNAHYGKYYDDDIYGAEDLTTHGEWIYTKDYGHVWRPFDSSISRYASWSPYRYGHWRWVPPFGWAWVNDEPWGWATYHYGRWFHYGGRWHWSPYGHIRRSRSWWAPALVGFTIINQNVCWYPLPYRYNYFNFNFYFGGWGGTRGGHHGGPRGPRNPRGNSGGGGQTATGPTPTPGPPGTGVGPGTPGQVIDKDIKAEWLILPPNEQVPFTGVITTPLSSFGREKTRIVRAAPVDANVALTKSLTGRDPIRVLPTYQELDGRVDNSIKTEKPRRSVSTAGVPIGASVRDGSGTALDPTLRNKKIFGDRTPIRPEPSSTGTPETRKTGAVTREPIRPERTPTTVPPIRSEPIRPDVSVPQPTKPRVVPERAPIRSAPPTVETQKPRSTPIRPERNDPPPTRSEPTRKADPPPTRSEPTRSPPTRKPDPPSKKEPAKSEPSKPEASKKRDNGLN
ncbi:MAG: DUF6600 domain-containing protein [Pyrinomonadaceae bacterium]